MKKDIKTPFLYMPKRMGMIYVNEDQEVHELSGIVWGRRLWRRKDRALFPLQVIAPMVYGFGNSGEAQGPTGKDGKPVIQ